MLGEIVLRVSRLDLHGIGKSPLAPLCQRGVVPPLGKGRVGGILQTDVFIILRMLIIGHVLTPEFVLTKASHLFIISFRQRVIL